MINKEGKLNLSVSGGSDLNQDLIENIDYTKSNPESEMMNDDNHKISDIHNKVDVEKDNELNENSQPTQMENSPTENDMPYDVPDDQTPPMTDMPKNIEKMTKKSAPDQSA